MFVLYEVFLYLVLIVFAPWFLIIGFLRGKYLSNLPERLGRYRTKPESHDIWIHAVSVGEVMAARAVMVQLLKMRPDTSVVVTTTTITGQAMARRLFPGSTVTYFPFDFTFAVNRFLEHHRPRVCTTLETEIWPNVTRLADRRGIRLLLANGRLSDRSYPRYRMFRPLVRETLRRYLRILAREPLDRDRFIELGADPEKTEVAGNVKFDFDVDAAPLEFEPRLLEFAAGRPILVAGSTVDGEDEMLLPHVQQLIASGWFVAIAPRKPERFEIVAALIETAGVAMVRRSEIESRSEPADVFLLDSIGELARLYRNATVAFVGGSLVPSGGHNPIEPAAAGAPVAFGPDMSNFREIASTFLESEGAVEVRDAEELVEFVERIRRDPELRERFRKRGLETVTRNRGASLRTAERIAELLA